MHVQNTLYSLAPPDKNAVDIETDSSHLQQFYTKPVRIVGNVHVNNLILTNEASVDSWKFEPNIEKFYWLKNTYQEIPQPIQLYGAVACHHLLTKSLNSFDMNKYLLTNKLDEVTNPLIFEEAWIRNIQTKNSTVWPNLQELEEVSVKMGGTFVIEGEKTFIGSILIDNLKTDRLNETSVPDFVTKNTQLVTGIILN